MSYSMPRQVKRIWIAILFLVILPRGSDRNSVSAESWKPNPQFQAGLLGQDVNPFIGTGGLSYLCGNNFPGATLPFGMVRLSPDTISTLGQRAINSSGYYYPDPRILGFSHTRLAGTGATEGGNFLVVPCVSESAKSVRR